MIHVSAFIKQIRYDGSHTDTKIFIRSGKRCAELKRGATVSRFTVLVIIQYSKP